MQGEKEFLTVLDFIGNYEKAGRVRFLLEGKSDMYREGYHYQILCDFRMTAWWILI